MKVKSVASLMVLGLLGCATPSSDHASAIGGFVMAGPTNAIAPEMSMRWQYGLKLSIDPKSISEIKFSCDPIPGTTFSAKGPDLKILDNGIVSAGGPVLAVSNESTPWLFQSSTTSAQCRAVVSRVDQEDAVVTAPVSFPPSQKAATLQQFSMAHEYNSKLKK
ncbi:MAG TPA: hypothetical protein VFV71_01985 [Burkholderiales bacterium]|nr:hypothetical protein [Burkholderiales bacterium]